jgi:hypothetical protein
MRSALCAMRFSKYVKVLHGIINAIKKAQLRFSGFHLLRFLPGRVEAESGMAEAYLFHSSLLLRSFKDVCIPPWIRVCEGAGV